MVQVVSRVGQNGGGDDATGLVMEMRVLSAVRGDSSELLPPSVPFATCGLRDGGRDLTAKTLVRKRLRSL